MSGNKTSGSDRGVCLTCFNCGHEWNVELKKDQRIGTPETWGFMVNRGKVCLNTEGYGTCAPVSCPNCYAEGRHKIRSLHTVSEQSSNASLGESSGVDDG